MADQFIIETAALRKDYEGVEALRGLNLQVPKGSICGFLGRNGSGKTTTIKILLGMVRPASGQARVFGLAADAPQASLEIRRRTGFVSDDKDLYGYLTVEEMIRFTASFFPRWRKDLEQRYLRSFALPPDRKIKALSRGMRTKLALLLVLCRSAELLILDEPTAGLDPAMTEEVLQALVAHVATEEMTVFFSSHQIAEVDQVADRVAIIHRGRTVLTGSLDDIRENFRRIQLVFDGEAPEPAFHTPGVERVWRKGRVLNVLSSAGTAGVLDEVRPLGPVSVDIYPVSLKEIFLETAVDETAKGGEMTMLWYKSWMETRWRFLIGLALLICSAAGTVLAYPQLVKLLPLVPKVDLGGAVGRRVTESLELARDYHGYIWSQWFRQNMMQLWGLFAVLIGSGGLLAQTSGSGTLFTLSLPVTRNRLFGVRAATGLAELLVLAFVPSLLLPVLSPAIGQGYSIADALIHSTCLFIAGVVLFSLTALLSTVFSDVWRPPLLVLCVTTLLMLLEQILPDPSRYSLFRVMSAEVYFRTGGLPWLALFISAALSAAMLYASTRNIARQDF